MDAHINLINNDKPVVVCCGDSITHGHIGYDGEFFKKFR